MPYAFPPDLSALVEEHMASGKYVSEDDLLRSALLALADEEADLAAVREAIDGWRGGDPGIPLDAAVEAIRAKHHPGTSE
jgi:Arc/MetJ-type ribon-helix-helix transcriptional regulator